jgi:hypothetical protein
MHLPDAVLVLLACHRNITPKGVPGRLVSSASGYFAAHRFSRWEFILSKKRVYIELKNSEEI